MKALLVLPVPVGGRLFCKLLMAVSRQWEAQHPGRTMMTTHLETRVTEFGPAVIVWDEPVDEGAVGG